MEWSPPLTTLECLSYVTKNFQIKTAWKYNCEQIRKINIGLELAAENLFNAYNDKIKKTLPFKTDSVQVETAILHFRVLTKIWL